MTPALVDARDLGRSFGTGAATTLALRPVTFAIAAGERIALTGPSGSGKSTLLNLIAGLDTPTSGTIAWPALGGVASLRPLNVGVIHQFAALVPSLSVAENVALPLRLAGLPAVNAAVVDALDAVGIADLADRLPHELSGGQAQRAGIARVLAHAPRLILADEPTGQLDRATADRVMDAILAAATRTGAAVVVATHDAVVAARLDHRWVVESGAVRRLEMVEP